MPDPTYKTFLSPGSCQLEVTDLVASANDDIGVDLYGVAWEIEQVLIAGEGFAASPTDVWVNERGILNIGQSLFDKINRTAEDNDNVPGQCTVVVKATSLVDSSKVARLKVLVGYPGEGGGGGGGGGLDVGNVIMVLHQEDTPVVNAEISENITGAAHIVFTGEYDGTQTDLVINNVFSGTTIDSVASGLGVITKIAYTSLESNPPTFYDVQISDGYEFTSVTETDVEYTTIGSQKSENYGLVFTVPDLAVGHSLVFTATFAR